MTDTRPHSHAFSLVELAVVLVILGLLVGSVLSGQALVRASQLRSVATEYQQYLRAATSFREKYFYPPGDIPNATAIWGAVHASANLCRRNLCTSPAGSKATCNGSGSGDMVGFTTISNCTSTVSSLFWKHLANADLISGSYSQIVSNVAGGPRYYSTSNSPASKVSGGIWTINTDSRVQPDSTDTRYAFVIGGPNTWTTMPYLNKTAIFRPEEIWNIDTKIDDGKPVAGKVTAETGYGAANCTTGDTATDTYQLTNTDISCIAYFYAK